MLSQPQNAQLIADVRGCTLGWYGFTDGGNLADLILRADNPAKNAREIAKTLLKLAEHLESADYSVDFN